ncbi:MAG: PatB family C-S lyase [Verrucomicrobiales bacterium]|nr:PatB family C-S lyase [Verrucomicrobiales bacterium]
MPTAPPNTSIFDVPVERRHTGSLKWDKYEDRDILPFWVADMDFISPDCVIRALSDRIDHGVFGYGRPRPSLNDAVTGYLQNSHSISAEPDHLVWLPGLVPAINMACRAVGDIGDSVMTCSPVYPPFRAAPANADRKLIDVPLVHRDDGVWTFDFPAMEAAVQPDTRLFILCNPHNPTGRVYNRLELDTLFAFCEKHDLVLCSDEIHCDLILNPDTQHISAAAVAPPSLQTRLITLHAPSKTYNIAGMAFSYAVIPDPKLRTRFNRAGAGFLPELNVAIPYAAEAAYRHGEPWRRELIDYLRDNRDTLYAYIADHMPQLKLSPMDATYLAWIDARSLNLPDPVGFFEKHGVALSDGKFFGLHGFVRFNFGCTRALMLEGLSRMKAAIANLP